MPVLADCNMQHLIKCYRSSNERAVFMEKEKKKLARYKGQPQKCVKGYQFLSLEMGSSACLPKAWWLFPKCDHRPEQGKIM